LGYISAIKRLETAVEKKKRKEKKFYSILLLSKKERKWVESLRVEVCRKWLEITFSLFVAKKNIYSRTK
jgi:hypothetical protein